MSIILDVVIFNLAVDVVVVVDVVVDVAVAVTMIVVPAMAMEHGLFEHNGGVRFIRPSKFTILHI